MKRPKGFFPAVLALFLVTTVPAVRAQIRGTIIGPAGRAYPIALAPLHPADGTLRAGGRDPGVEFVDILGRDLELSGLFRVLDREAYLENPTNSGISAEEIRFENWSVIGALALVKGSYAVEGERLTVEARLFDVYQRRQLAGSRYKGTVADLRRMAHKFADKILEEFTGERGPFDTQIAFISTRTGRFKDLFVMSPDGGDILQVTETRSIAVAPAWSPDGHRLAYTSYKYGNPDLYLIDFVTGRESRLSSGPGLHLGAEWSPDGQWIAVALEREGNSEIVLLDSKGRFVRRLTDHWGIDVSPTWSPDSSRIAFCSNRAGTPQIYVMNADGTDIRRITYFGDYNTSPQWSPKGDRIAFASRRAGNEFDIFVVRPDGTDLRRITSGPGSNEDPSWSPDGRYLVFSSTREGPPLLYLTDAEGRHQVALTGPPGGDTSPAWSRWRE
ncbi:MAG: protein TolB [Candidatus Binatia bacterium]|nr:MAG: protein TolB [Candidatus Binatia bacterium]